MSIIQLECGCNNYPWGKRGKESLAARYAAATPGGHFKLDESKEYAEVCCHRCVVYESIFTLWEEILLFKSWGDENYSSLTTVTAMDGNISHYPFFNPKDRRRPTKAYQRQQGEADRAANS